MKFLTRFLNVICNWVILVVVFLLDSLYGFSYDRFFVLETIARIPYFAYLSVLHLYQTFGKHPAQELMDLHYHETRNEEFHLRVMEELGGGNHWFDRLFARMLGVLYFWTIVFLYILSPSSGYYLMELVEKNAVLSYSKFLDTYENDLKIKPAGVEAKRYFFLTEARMTPAPNPNMFSKVTLFDVFTSIRDDEQVHVVDMQVCKKMDSLFTDTPGQELEQK